MPPRAELPVFSAWFEITSDVLGLIGRFPRNLRPTIGQRMGDGALNVLDCIVQLRYTRDRTALFASANLELERMRVYARLSHARRVISGDQYHQLAEGIDRCGRMLGGWAKAKSLSK